jgi:endonuclease YncB( thermonuclease family)
MRRPIITVLIVVLVMTFVLPWASPAEWVHVDRVIDGDTFVTSDGTKVRIKNIDTPETKHPTREAHK